MGKSSREIRAGIALKALAVTGTLPAVHVSYLLFGFPKGYLNLIRTSRGLESLPQEEVSYEGAEEVIGQLSDEQLEGISEIRVLTKGRESPSYHLDRNKLEIVV